MSGFARFILINYKQDLLGENTVDNTVDQKIALPFYVTRSSSRSAALLLVPAGGTLASRAGGLRPLWVAFGHLRSLDPIYLLTWPG